jgi:hypothetical protein
LADRGILFVYIVSSSRAAENGFSPLQVLC